MNLKIKLKSLLFLISLTSYHFAEVEDIKDIQFETADLVVDYKTDNVKFSLEAFKSKETKSILESSNKTQNEKLKWLSIGAPSLVHLNSSLSNYIVFNDQEFYFKINMLTDFQKAKFIDIVKQKYGIDILPSQIISLLPSKFVCTISFFDKNKLIEIRGISLNVNELPIRVDFLEPSTSPKRLKLEEKLKKEEFEPKIVCKFQVNGKISKQNRFQINVEKIQKIGLVEKLFGPASSVLVTREQLSKLSSEIYLKMDIIENYEISEMQFSEKFIEDFISQTSKNAFEDVKIEEALKSLSKYNFEKDIQPDIVLNDMSKIFKLETVGNKKRIVLNKEHHSSQNRENESTNQNSFNAAFNLGNSGLNFGTSSTKSNKKSQGSTEDIKSLDDQLRELNKHTEDEVTWKIEGEKIIPKSIKVANLIKSQFSNTLSFKRVKNVQFDALFEKTFRLYTSSLSSVVPYDKYFAEIEKINIFFKNVSTKLEQSSVFRKGMITAIASKSAINWFSKDGVGFSDYTGWYLCNGLNNTPNLTGRFLVGMDSKNLEYSEIGKVGGLNKVKLDVSELPSHNHIDEGHTHSINLKSSLDGEHQHIYEDSKSACCSKGEQHSGNSKMNDNLDQTRYTQISGRHNHKISGSTGVGKANISFTGPNREHENRPPYFVVAYIIYFG